MKTPYTLLALVFVCLNFSNTLYAEAIPYQLEELKAKFRYSPIVDYEIDFNKEQLEAGLSEGGEIEIFSRLFLVKYFRYENKADLLYEAYLACVESKVDDQLVAYVLYEIGNAYLNRMDFLNAMVCAGKGLTIAEEGSYEWLLNWYVYSMNESDEKRRSFIIDATDDVSGNINDFQKFNLIYVARSVLSPDWGLQKLIEWEKDTERFDYFFKLNYWKLRLRFYVNNGGEGDDPDRIKSRLMNCYDKRMCERDERCKIDYYFSVSNISAIMNDYVSASQFSDTMLFLAEQYYGEYDSMFLDEKFDYNFLKHSWARDRLFLTRVGRGLDPVKEAFNAYREVASEEAELIALNCGESNLVHFLRMDPTPHHIFVIGGYLYDETCDLFYLDESLRAVDRVESLISVYNNSEIINRREWIGEQYRLEADWRGSVDALSIEDSDFDALIDLSRKRTEMYLDAMRNDLSSKKSIDFLPRVNITDLQDSLKVSQSSLLYLTLRNDLIVSFLVTPDQVFFKYYLPFPESGGSKERVNSLGGYLKSYRMDPNQVSEMDEALRSFYSIVIKEYELYLTKNLTIIPCGDLELLPFSVLRMDTAGQNPIYLGDRFNISYNSSLLLREQALSHELEEGRSQVLGFAPAFSMPVLYSGEDGAGNRQVGALTNNIEEVSFLEDNFPGNFFYRESATRDEFEAAISGYKIIHLATHAEANASNGRKSRMYFYGEDPEDDRNILYANQIPEMDLNAEMVVLSACETGTGAVHGYEGILGLTQSFIAAGAKSVVSTRWAVDDRATAEIMADFYIYLKEGLRKDESLRLAQRDYRERHAGTDKALPFYWAAFDVIGDPSPLEFKSDFYYDWWKWLAKGSLGLLVLVGVSRWRSRVSLAA